MMMKKWLVIAIVAMLICTMSITLIGCNKHYKEVSVADACGEVMEKMLKHHNVDTAQALGVEAIFKLSAKETKNTTKLVDLHVEVAANIDMTPMAKNTDNNFVINIINNKNNDEKLLGIYSDGEYLYIDSKNSHYKIENFRIHDLLKGSNTQDFSCVTGVAAVFAGIFFDKAEVDGGAYVFHYNLGNVLSNIKRILQDMGASSKADELAKTLMFADWNDLHSQLSQIVGRVEYHFTGDKLVSKNWYNKSKNHEFSMKTDGLKLVNGRYTINFNELIKDKTWTSTKLLNLTASGELNLKSEGETEAKFTWELHSNLDLFELIANGGDFNLDKDDMAHFVLRNNIADNSEEYNQSRINSKSGVIFELAYDPIQLGTKNVLMAVNLKALLPKNLGKELKVPAIALNMIPDYYGLYIDSDIIKEIFSGANAGGSQLSSIVRNSIVRLAKNGFDLSMGALDENSDSYNMLNMFTAVGDKKIDSIDFKISKLIFADMANKEYKPSEHFLNIANEETSEPKDFGEALGFIPSKESAPITLNGKATFNLSDGTVISGNDKLTEQQINKIVGGTVDYTYTGFDNKHYNSVLPVKIIAISGLDNTKLDQSQTVKFITSPADGKNLIGFLTSIDALPPIPTNVYTFDIILTK